MSSRKTLPCASLITDPRGNSGFGFRASQYGDYRPPRPAMPLSAAWRPASHARLLRVHRGFLRGAFNRATHRFDRPNQLARIRPRLQLHQNRYAGSFA